MRKNLALLLIVAARILGAEGGSLSSAVELYDTHKFEAAEGVLAAEVARQPANAQAQFYYGAVEVELDKPEKAIAALEAADKIKPQDARTLNMLGDAYGLAALKANSFSKLSLARKSAAAYASAVELDPQNTHYHWSYLDFCRQAPGFAGGGLDRAYHQAKALGTIDAQQGILATAELKIDEKKYDEAFAALDSANTAAASGYGVLVQRGRAAALSGQRVDDGIASLRRCLALEPSDMMPEHSEVSWLLGQLLESKGEFTAAENAYLQATKLDPGFAPASESLQRLREKNR